MTNPTHTPGSPPPQGPQEQPKPLQGPQIPSPPQGPQEQR
jgi:hypothetical protein